MNLDVEFSRRIDATPEEVFDAVTTPEGQEAFYGKEDTGWIVEPHCDLRVGVEWTIDFGPSPVELYRHRHFPTIELRDEHQRGVPDAFALLERFVQARETSD